MTISARRIWENRDNKLGHRQKSLVAKFFAGFRFDSQWADFAIPDVPSSHQGLKTASLQFLLQSARCCVDENHGSKSTQRSAFCRCPPAFLLAISEYLLPMRDSVSYCVDFFGVGFVNDSSGVAEIVLGFCENAGCVVLEPINSSTKR